MDADRLTQDHDDLLESKHSISNLRAQKMSGWESCSMVHAGQGALVYVAYKQDPRHRVLLIASSGNSLSDMLACPLSARNAISLRMRKIKLRMSVWSTGFRLVLCGPRFCALK